MIGSLLTIVVYIVVIGLIYALLHYLIDAIPVPEPFNRWAKLVLFVFAVLIVILLLLSLVGAIDAGLPRIR